jgi:hypothetical protein
LEECKVAVRYPLARDTGLIPQRRLPIIRISGQEYLSPVIFVYALDEIIDEGQLIVNRDDVCGIGRFRNDSDKISDEFRKIEWHIYKGVSFVAAASESGLYTRSLPSVSPLAVVMEGSMYNASPREVAKIVPLKALHP